MKPKDRKTIQEFLNYYFQTRRFQYQKSEIENFKALLELGVLYEVESDRNALEIASYSNALQKVLLDVAEQKLNTKLPIDILSSFKFIDDFEELLKREYNCENFLNAFDIVIRGLKPYVLNYLSENDIDVKEFFFSLESVEEREPQFYLFERSFIEFLYNSNYSEKDVFEILNKLWEKDGTKRSCLTCLRTFPRKNLKKSNQLLEHALQHGEPIQFVQELYIGFYSLGEQSSIDKIIDLKSKDELLTLSSLGRLPFQGKGDIEKAFNQIGELAFEDVDFASRQSNILRNIISNELTPPKIIDKSFKLFHSFLERGIEGVLHIVFQNISFIDGYELGKYELLIKYVSKTKNIRVIDSFFIRFKDPTYLFDMMIKLFAQKPDFRFSTHIFENGISHFWNINQSETEDCILNLFKEHPAFGILSIKIILSKHLDIYKVDLLKLENPEFQINAISNICKFPHSFDKLLPLILPLRKVKNKEVREHLQKSLSHLVFYAYHEVIYEQIKNNIGTSRGDKEFLKPIKKALDNYNGLKTLKETIKDLDPFENERDLMDLYYKLEREEQAKLMNDPNLEKGFLTGFFKKSIVVRGNSSKINDRTPIPMNLIESSILIDGSSYLNPDLYEYNLNNII